MKAFASLLLIVIMACSGDDAPPDSSVPTDSNVGDVADVGDAPDAPVGGPWSLEVEPQETTRRISLERYGDGLLLIEYESSAALFHRISTTGELLWSWSPEAGDVRHVVIGPDDHLYVTGSIDVATGGNRTQFISVDGGDGSERWFTTENFTLGWCRGVCAVDANNSEYIADVALSESHFHYSGRYTADPRHLFGSIDIATGMNESNETTDRATYYRRLFDVPGPAFIGILSSSGGWERRLLDTTWGVTSMEPAALEDQYVEHPMGLLTFVAASTELVLIDESMAVVSQAPWTPPSADFDLESATGDSLVASHTDAGLTFVGVTVSTGTTDWEATYAAGAASDISDTSLVAAEPSATSFDFTRLARTDGSTTDTATLDADLCELVEGAGPTLAIAEHTTGAFAAHCGTSATGATIIRVRPIVVP